jgi:hypothetical protein
VGGLTVDGPIDWRPRLREFVVANERVNKRMSENVDRRVTDEVSGKSG